MPDKLEEIALGQEAIDYISESLRDGKELSSMILNAVELQSGSVVTYLPTKPASFSINQFRSGGIVGGKPDETLPKHELSAQSRFSPIPNLDHCLISLVTAYLESATAALCLFENQLAQPSDAWLRNSTLHNLNIGATVCHSLTAKDVLDAELISQTVKKSRSIRPPLIGLFTSVSNGKVHALDEASLKTMVEHTQRIVVGAYDGEGFLLWRR